MGPERRGPLTLLVTGLCRDWSGLRWVPHEAMSERPGKITARERRRIVRPAPRGGWAVCVPGVARAVVVLPTRGDAVARAKRILASRGGGEVVVLQDGHVEYHAVGARTNRRLGRVPLQRRSARSVGYPAP